MTAKRQRLALVLAALTAIVAAALLALSALKDQAAFFYSPGDIDRSPPAHGKSIRLGGMVRWIQREKDGVTIAFGVTDGVAEQVATYRGVTPDLFRVRSGVVAEGAIQSDGLFHATTILAKHDEKYMPPQAAGAMHETRTLRR